MPTPPARRGVLRWPPAHANRRAPKPRSGTGRGEEGPPREPHAHTNGPAGSRTEKTELSRVPVDRPAERGPEPPSGRGGSRNRGRLPDGWNGLQCRASRLAGAWVETLGFRRTAQPHNVAPSRERGSKLLRPDHRPVAAGSLPHGSVGRNTIQLVRYHDDGESLPHGSVDRNHVLGAIAEFERASLPRGSVDP